MQELLATTRGVRPRTRTAEIIGRRIVSGGLLPGTILPDCDQLAAELSTSSASVRQAVRLLADKGLVTSKPHAGAVVRPRSEWRRLDADVLLWQIGETSDAGFVDNLFEVRRIIEPDAAAIVAKRANGPTIEAMEEAVAAMAAHEPLAAESVHADLAFHQHLLTGTGNEFISGFARLLDPLLRALFHIQRAAKPKSEVFVADHRAVLDAIRRGDAEGARATAAALLKCAEKDALDGIRLLAPSAGSATARSIS